MHKKDNEEVNNMKKELRKETEILKQSNISNRDENFCQLSKKQSRTISNGLR